MLLIYLKIPTSLLEDYSLDILNGKINQNNQTAKYRSQHLGDTVVLDIGHLSDKYKLPITYHGTNKLICI